MMSLLLFNPPQSSHAILSLPDVKSRLRNIDFFDDIYHSIISATVFKSPLSFHKILISLLIFNPPQSSHAKSVLLDVTSRIQNSSIQQSLQNRQSLYSSSKAHLFGSLQK